MKLKILISVTILMLVLCVAMLGIPISIVYDNKKTNDELEHFLLEYERGNLTVTADGDTEVILSPANLSRVITLISPTERKRELFAPKLSGDPDISINIGGSAGVYLIAGPDKGYQDSVYVYYLNGKKTRCYSITGYRVLDTVGLAVSPEGVFGANTIK